VSRFASASLNADVRLDVWFCGELERGRPRASKSMGAAIWAMALCCCCCCCCGLSGNREKLQSPASSNRISLSGRWRATSSCGWRWCQAWAWERLALGSLGRPKCGKAGCWTGVLMGVLAAVDSRGEWERGGGDVSWESSLDNGVLVLEGR